MKYCFL